jgi:hypothetical protein
MFVRRLPLTALTFTLAASFVVSMPAQQAPQVNPALFSDMRWRNIGPHRAGRTKAAAGVPSQPYTFYIGMVNGGVWKTTDAGRTWNPIFDDQPTGSIGWVSVALSDPNVIYVGSGEGLPRPDLAVGDGIYKSTDAGQTWTHLGLRDAQQIPKIAIDPKNANRLRRRARHPTPEPEREIFRSTDGGGPSKRACSSTRTPAARTSTSIRRIPTSSMRRCGSNARARGRTARGAGRTAASSSRPTGARHGSR